MEQLLQQLVNGLAWGSIYALIALGYTMVYGILQLINFAHGDVYMIGAMAGFYAAAFLGFRGETGFFPFIIVLLAAMLACGVLGYAIERVVYRPIRRAPRLSALITAIGMSLFLEYGGQILFGADPKFYPQLFTSEAVFRWGTVSISNLQLLIFVVTIIMMLALRFIVMETRVGKAMRAVSFHAGASSLMGINVNKIIAFTFILGSVLAAAAGTLVGLSNPKIDPLMGIMPGIKAFVAAVLGGIGSIPGAMLGGIIMGLAEVLVVGYISSTFRDAIAFIILIMILLVKPTGLLGSTVREKV
ncbi:MAG: ABC transporter permease [Deltaproteobacteria bacterium RIFCSPHIGHO2_12_FULL_43_9]|nr:MAG: ABC transporter permease [Deltaproteobacteria bacterium RIFCSPHIGHO2_12_FULL_43_9]